MEQYNKIIKWFMFAILFIGAGLPAARDARAVTGPEPNVFDFERFTLDDALRRLAKTGGIKIRLNRPPVGGIGRKYRGDDPEQVIRDIFRQDNVTIEWLYNQGRLEEVVIRLYDGQGDAGPSVAAAAPDDDGAYHRAGLRAPSYSAPLWTESSGASRNRSDAPAAGVAEMENPAPSQTFATAGLPPVGALGVAAGAVGGGFLNKAMAGGGSDAWAKNVAAKPLATSAAKRVLEPPPMPPGFPD